MFTAKYDYSIRWMMALAVSATVILLYQFDIFERLELLTLDYRFKLKTPSVQSSDVVFIDMAEDSIHSIGRWPWPRSWHATLITALGEYKPRAIVFDVLFSEPQDALDDSAMAEAMRQAQCVYLPVLFDFNIKEAAHFYGDGGTGALSAIEPIPQLKKYAKGEGHINAMPDIDGVLRRVPPVIMSDGKPVYQLGLKAGLDLLGVNERGGVSFDPARHKMSVWLADNTSMKIPLDDKNQFIINWKAKWGGEFKHFSYIDVIKAYAIVKKGGAKPAIDLNEFRGKICVIGLTAAGLTDIKPVPMENAYPAVGVNATMISNVLNKNFIHSLPKPYNMLIILLVSVLVTMYLFNLRLMGGIALAALGIVCYMALSVLLFNFFNILITVFYPVLAIALSYAVISLYAQIVQAAERANLFRQATHDGLTGLYNIRHFNLLLEAELKNVLVYKTRRLAIIMADIDNFKHINDTYGHRSGDVMLREFAKTIQSKCRRNDIVARYGGEEFVIMLTGAGEKEAFEIAEKIREAVQGREIRFKNKVLSTTMSLGAAEFSGERDREDLIEKADSALYKAKSEGKNRVYLYSAISR